MVCYMWHFTLLSSSYRTGNSKLITHKWNLKKGMVQVGDWVAFVWVLCWHGSSSSSLFASVGAQGRWHGWYSPWILLPVSKCRTGIHMYWHWKLLELVQNILLLPLSLSFVPHSSPFHPSFLLSTSLPPVLSFSLPFLPSFLTTDDAILTYYVIILPLVEDDTFLPCEFCQELFPFDNLIVHQVSSG